MTQITNTKLQEMIDKLAVERAKAHFLGMLKKVEAVLKDYWRTSGSHRSNNVPDEQQTEEVKAALVAALTLRKDAFYREQEVQKDEYIVKQVKYNKMLILDEILNKLPLITELTQLQQES